MEMKDIATIGRTKEIVEKYNFSTKKSLGQNFLIDRNIIQEVLKKARINDDIGVIEVGPGIGSLTEQLAKVAKKVVAFEIDDRLIPVLNDTLSPYDNIKIIHEDVLQADIGEVIKEEFSDVKEVIVVANLPYYITTPILMNFLMYHKEISRFYTMMQKEVGERLSASPSSKSYGSLSIAIQYYTEAKIIQNVPKTVFMPPPNVDSIVVELVRHENPPVKVDDEETFFKLTRGAFVMRRKTIYNNYQSLFKDGKKKKEDILAMLEAAEIDPKRRGESLSIQEYARIYESFKNSNLKF
ncbi:16S rRNA (adenine(1518)-N(6)/adenine(1519)-N(6))-dimethyltransferase RsmA [Nosocomiicoccus sp. HMSC09A07]|uniref:16S rRNA (adenine(1518)-N(6)/adenine(1519)-N(6))- dimethyltransferase RsmA n=1 Tax=Nosocomiicoccus sp. HMSC09A07 TaxID=1581145 RepID=UPI0008A4A2D7|nr:16S rRNA (adenine(1518)-N(6)/adenine(1519)-N(6))-dimethyltransferase RsmA [Nosocomiicoccus sp. HMSC09A07]OFS61824.1 16S rRNA (adenine(1518)-N(6)/adenine(1519)-N(6))-dimethyltransferase [Nosocomiicoccus sp. HMSC09A07]